MQKKLEEKFNPDVSQESPVSVQEAVPLCDSWFNDVAQRVKKVTLGPADRIKELVWGWSREERRTLDKKLSKEEQSTLKKEIRNTGGFQALSESLKERGLGKVDIETYDKDDVTAIRLKV